MKTVQLTKAGTIISASKVQIREMRSQFKQMHYLCFPEFLETSLLKNIQREIKRAQFRTKKHVASGVELGMKDNEAMRLLQFILNEPQLFDFLEKVTGCKSINFFLGRIYLMRSDGSHYHDWHSDNKSSRLLGVSINLSSNIFEGGSLQLRDAKSNQVLQEVTNAGFGDLLIFRIAKELEHCVMPVTGKVPKIACAGWFQAEPHYATFLKQFVAHAKA